MRRLPFWGLQSAELAIALILVDVSVHISHAGLLVAAAAALGILALSARGPLGLLRVCSQRTHVVLCVPVAGLVLVAPILPALRPGTGGIVVVVVAMLALLRLATITRTDPRPRQQDHGGRMAGAGHRCLGHASRRQAFPPIPPIPPIPVNTTDPPAVPRPGPDVTSDPLRRRGAAGSTSDLLARLAGEASATGKKAARQHRPAVEAERQAGHPLARPGGGPDNVGHSAAADATQPDGRDHRLTRPPADEATG